MANWWAAQGLYVFLSFSGNIIWWDTLEHIHDGTVRLAVDQHAESD